MDALTRRVAARDAHPSTLARRLAWFGSAYGGHLLAAAVAIYVIYAASTLGFTPERFLRGLEHGSVTRLAGPYIVSGGWWASEVHREYHYAETRRGECLWVYYDRHRRRWFLHGLFA